MEFTEDKDYCFYPPVLGKERQFYFPHYSANPLFVHSNKETHEKLKSLLKSLSMSFKLIGHGKHFEDDTAARYIYEITIERDKKKISFEFGSSIRDTEIFLPDDVRRSGESNKQYWDRKEKGGLYKRTEEKRDFFKSFLYSILTCIASDYMADVGSFEDFCSEFGYDMDSRKAEKTYFAVQKQANKLKKIFTEEEISWFPN